MGTIFNQKPRNYRHVEVNHIEDLIDDIQGIAKKRNLKFEDVLRLYEVKERQRTNDLFVSNADVHDEQMSGLGTLLQDLVGSINELSRRIEHRDAS